MFLFFAVVAVLFLLALGVYLIAKLAGASSTYSNSGNDYTGYRAPYQPSDYTPPSPSVYVVPTYSSDSNSGSRSSDSSSSYSSSDSSSSYDSGSSSSDSGFGGGDSGGGGASSDW